MNLLTDKEIQSAIKEYLKSLSGVYVTNSATGTTELSYRTAFQNFLQAVLPEASIIQEAKHIKKCGAPDFVLNHNDIPRGYIETKDVDRNLDDKKFKEQFNRYSESLGNLIFTNYLEFRLVCNGDVTQTAIIGTIVKGKIKAMPQNFPVLTELLTEFWGYQGLTIKSADNLAKHMAAKARMLASVIERALEQDENIFHLHDVRNRTPSALQIHLNGFRTGLMSDLDIADFADIYAQTIAYGLFCARLHDKTPNTFTRDEANKLIPKSNPFLETFFRYITDFNVEPRIQWIIDNLIDLFSAANVKKLMKGYGEATQLNDPFIHFYETFLGEFKPKLRKSRGVYYTPEPVVNFIVRTVNKILQTEFGLSKGLACSSKITVDVDDQGPEGKSKLEVHRVQILDPAAGTGTFLSNIVQHIYEERFSKQDGAWSDYVFFHLIPRLIGFEVLMAPYVMAHTKLEMVLRDFKIDLGNERLNIFLTNSLEEYKYDKGNVFIEWLAKESLAANYIKSDTPVMVVIGNPPYSGISSNKGKWISNLVEEYKYIDGEYFDEKKHWLNDDYVKFIRFGQYHIDRTGEGVLAYINSHSYLDNSTFRGMRWSLLQSFDEIYIIDLHGNSIKKETAPDGSTDKNVFDIQTGVSINLFIKTGQKKTGELAQVLHYDKYGTREEKYQFLRDHNLPQISFKKLKPHYPHYFFVPEDNTGKKKYDKGLAVHELFNKKVTGIVTARDKLVIDINKNDLLTRISEFTNLDNKSEDIREKYFRTNSKSKYPPGDTRGWKLDEARTKIKGYNHDELIKVINYRPFDVRCIYYHQDMIDWGREKVMQHFIKGENVGLVFRRQQLANNQSYYFITNKIIADGLIRSDNKGCESVAPLYHYPDDKQKDIESNRVPNLNQCIVKSIENKLGLRFTHEKQEDDASFAPVDILDYIYAVLHSPSYRKRYKAFLKIDFPKVPYPSDKKLFRKLVKLGGELRSLHLMESQYLETLITSYDIQGNNSVDKVEYKNDDKDRTIGNVYINEIIINEQKRRDNQCFGGVPKDVWEFQMGAYRPAQKWLKDRIGRKLTSDDIEHYQKIIVALKMTGDIMSEIDTIPIAN